MISLILIEYRTHFLKIKKARKIVCYLNVIMLKLIYCELNSRFRDSFDF